MRALHMTWRWTGGGMAQAVAHGDQFADRSVQFVGLGSKLSPVDTRPSVGCEHLGNVIEREAGRAPQRDQRQAVQDLPIEQPAQTAPAD